MSSRIRRSLPIEWYPPSPLPFSFLLVFALVDSHRSPNLTYFVVHPASSQSADCQEHKSKGEFAFQAGKYESALDYFTDAINCDSGDLSSYLSRARVKHATSKPKAALYDLNLILNKDSGHADALEFRSRVKIEMGKYDDALEDLAQLKKNPERAALAQDLVRPSRAPSPF